jgi:hypothetical protein
MKTNPCSLLSILILKQRVLKIIALLFFSLMAASVSYGQIVTLQAWNTNGNSGITADGWEAQTVATGMLTSELSRGSGLTATSLANGFAASGWDSEERNDNDYFEFYVEATAGNVVSLASINYNTRRTSSGPSFLQWGYSVDGSPFTLIGSPIAYNNTTDGFAQPTLNLTGITELQNVSERIVFRLYGWGASSAGGTLSFGRTGAETNDLVVSGTVGEPGDPGEPIPPALGEVDVSGITTDEATLSAIFNANDGAGFTDYGFVIAASSVSDTPTLGEPGMVNIDFDHSVDPIPSPIMVVVEGLDPETSYSVRAYVIYNNGDDIVYSPTTTAFTTSALPPILDGVTSYTEDFADFVSLDTLPAGWSFDLQGSNGDYIGDWGFVPAGSTSGFRGNASVLGYQLTTGSNSLVKILTLVNNTGETITDLTIQYTGRVERLTATRNAEYTVTVDGVAVPALTYSTAAGVDQTLGAIVSGLDIVDGESFTIEWQATQLEGVGDTRQIGLSNVNVSVGANQLPPTIGFFALFDGSLTETAFGVDAEVTSDGGSAVTQVGFVLSETDVEPNPTLGTPNTLIVIDDLFDGDFFLADFENLEPGTRYSVRAFATNAVGTTYTAPLVITTIAPPLSLLAETEYIESFSNFTGVLPDGWSISGPVTAYNGNWGIGAGAGLRGGEETPGVLGFQHTASTGVFTVTLELLNDTGDTITDLLIAYTGRVERATEGRLPAWTVSVDGVEVPELSYSTAGGVDEDIEFILSGLNIANGETFTISWSSTRDTGQTSGASRQIGISNVSVEALVITVPTPIFSLSGGTFFSDQTVFISNFADYDASVDLYYTTDGSDPDSSSSLYDNEIGILLEDGFGPLTLSVLGIDSLTNEESLITSATYNFPLNVADLAELRAQPPANNAFFRVINTMILSGQDSFRNTKFFQDASGAGIQIDDNPGVIETEYVTGDAISSLLGTLTVFQGQLQLVPALDPGAPISSGNTLTPVTRTLATLSSSDQSILVRINEVEFEAGDGSSTFGAGGSQTAIRDSSIAEFTGIYRNFFGASNITGALIPEGVGSIVGIIQQRNDELTIGARNLDDLDFLPPPFIPDAFDDFVAVAPEGQRGIADAPAGDGVANLFKYAFGGSPIIADRSMLPFEEIVEDNGERYFAITFTPDRNFTWDPITGTFSDGVVLLTVEISTDLTDWNPATNMVLVGGGTELNSGQTITLRMATAIGQSTRTFLRINGERIEDLR